MVRFVHKQSTAWGRILTAVATASETDSGQQTENHHCVNIMYWRGEYFALTG